MFLLVLLLFFVTAMAAKAQGKENTEIMGKKNLGSLLALYPKPMTVVGTEVNGKVNWLVVGHTGIIGHDRIMVSLSKAHYTNQGIKQSKKLSVNLVSQAMLDKADYVGSVSGAETDKSKAFAYHMGENGSPVIDDAPITMECKVEDIYETEGFESFVCSIVNTYASEDVLDKDGKLDYSKLESTYFL